MTICNFLEDCCFWCYFCFISYKTTPFVYLFFRWLEAKYEKKLEAVLLVFTTQGNIVTRHITKYVYFNRIFNEESDGNTCVPVKVLCWALLDFLSNLYSLYSVVQISAKIFGNISSCFYKGRNCNCMYNNLYMTVHDRKFDKKSGGNIHILVYSLFLALLGHLFTPATRLCSLSCPRLSKYIQFNEVRRIIKRQQNVTLRKILVNPKGFLSKLI